MFHAVNQTPGAEEDDMLPTALPMFRDSSAVRSTSVTSTGAGARRPSQSSRGHDPSVKGVSIQPIARTTVSAAVAASALGGTAATERRPQRRALRSRKSGRMEVEMKAVGGGKEHQPTFARPDGLDDGLVETGTFRWNATVADAAEPEQDDSDNRDIEDAFQWGKGSLSRWGKQRLVLPGELGDIGPRRKPWYVILPESKMHQLFDHLGDLLTMYVMVAIPLFVSFQHIENMHAEDWYAFNVVVDLLFLVDLSGRLLTAYRDQVANRVVSEPAMIVRHYGEGLLVPDLIASVPLTIILGVRMVSISNKVTRLARMPQTLRVIRSIKALSEEVEENAHKNILMAAYNLVKVILYILLVMHWVACGWHLLADVESNELSWIEKDGLNGAPASKLYVTSVYWTVTTLSTVGYGDIFASTIAERTYCILVMLTGATMYALAIGAVSHIITKVVARHSQSRLIERHAELFVRMHSLPQDLAAEIMRTLNVSGETEAMAEKRAQHTLELLPANVRTATLLCIYRVQIARIPFFKSRRDVYPVFVSSVVRSLQAHVYPKKGEEVLVEDTTADDMIFLVKGRAVITRRGLEVGRMIAGCCFGASATMHGRRRKETVTCVTDCEMYTIEGTALRQIARTFPGPISELKEESERPLTIGGRTRGGIESNPLPISEADAAWKSGGSFTTPPNSPSAGTRTDGFAPPMEAGMRHPLSDNDVWQSTRRRKSVESTPGSDPGDFSRGGRGSLLSSSHGPCTLEAPSGDLKEVGGVHPSTVENMPPGARSQRRAMRALARYQAEATRVEGEVWDKLQHLNDSLKTMHHCLHECSVAHGQVVESCDVELEGAHSEDANDAPLVSLGSSRTAPDGGGGLT